MKHSFFPAFLYGSNYSARRALAITSAFYAFLL